MKKELPIITIEDCFSFTDVVLKLGLARKGSNTDKVRDYIITHNLDTSHFNKKQKTTKYKLITKPCPVCGKDFETKENSPREKQTCSHGCSNTYFRSGINNPNHKEDGNNSHRTICFSFHKKECIICGENNIVTVHHYDENHENNDPKNLVPLCPTHHQYVHSRFANLVKDKIDNYVINFKQ